MQARAEKALYEEEFRKAREKRIQDQERIRELTIKKDVAQEERLKVGWLRAAVITAMYVQYVCGSPADPLSLHPDASHFRAAESARREDAPAF